MSTSSVIMKQQIVSDEFGSHHASSDKSNALSSEIGHEILLVLLFCAGFGLFRIAAVRRIFGKKSKQLGGKGCKADTLTGKVADAVERTPSSSQKVASESASQAQGRVPSRNALRGVPNSGAHAFIQRIRNAVQDKQVDKAMKALASMANTGLAVPPSCVVAVLTLVQKTQRDNSLPQLAFGDALRALPPSVFSPEAVVAILECATRSSDVCLVKHIITYAKEIGVPLLPAACEAILRSFATVGDVQALEMFEELSGNLSEHAVIGLVSACADSRYVRLAERCIAHAREAQGKLTLPMYSALMKVYSHARLFQQICDLYASMQQDNVTPDTVAYGSLIRAAVESGRLELARQLFKQSGNPDLLNCMSLIRAAGRERNVAKALKLLEELEKSPLPVDVAAYNCTLEVCAVCGERAAAESLLHRMEKNNCADVVSYNTYLKILLASGAQRDVVEAILQNMQNRGINPNVVTYNSLVKAAVAGQDLMRAWQLINEMEALQVCPDSFSCSILVKGLKNSASAAELDKIIALIKRANIVPDEVLMNCLLDVCVRLRDAGRTTQILAQFKSTGVVPSPHACAMLIKAYGHARRPEQIWPIWREVSSFGGNANVQSSAGGVNEEIFSAMVEACLACGDISGVATVLRQVRSCVSTFQKSATIFAGFVKACVQNKRLRLALDLYNDMKGSIPFTKFTFNTLIDALVRDSDLDRATELFREMPLQGVTPDLITYSTLVKGHCTRGDLEQGLQLLGLMQRQGIAPDAVLFNSILDGCAHKQMRTLTEQVLKDMEAAGVKPSNFTISILVKLYGRCGDLDAAFEVFETYPKKYGFHLNTQVYTCLMSACIANGAQPRTLQLYDQMLRASCPCDRKTYHTLLCGCIRHADLDGAIHLIDDVLAEATISNLDRESVEGVLLMAVRQGRRSESAVPLFSRLQKAQIFVSERVGAIVSGSAEPSRGGMHLRNTSFGESCLAGA